MFICYLFTEKSCLTSELAELWHKEEVFWGQRSHVNWLQYGDSNSAFFHASTLQCRNLNSIIKLKGSDGQWLVSEDEIASHICCFYYDLFKSSRVRDIDTILEAMEPCVPISVNRLSL